MNQDPVNCVVNIIPVTLLHPDFKAGNGIRMEGFALMELRDMQLPTTSIVAKACPPLHWHYSQAVCNQ
jgi:hypothetical protein